MLRGWANASATIAIAATFAATAACGISRYQQQSKAAEARNALGQIGKDASAAFERESMPSVIGAGQAVTPTHALCLTASNSVPASAGDIRGRKYQSSRSDWDNPADAPNVGWKCLKFSMDEPQYYMYRYVSKGTGKAGDEFTATANGDLDGDGVLSTYSLTGKVDASGSAVSVAPAIDEKDPYE